MSLKVISVGPDERAIGGIAATVAAWREAEALAGVTLTAWSTSPSQRTTGRKRAMAAQLASFIGRIARGWRPDVVHVHIGGAVSYWRESAYAVAARRAGIPVVVHVHGCNNMAIALARSPLHRAAIRALLSDASAVFVAARSLAPVLARWVPRAPPARPLYNPVVRAGLPARRDRAPHQPLTVLFLGWMIEPKGIFDLLDAIPAVRAAVPDARFVFAGDGVALDAFRAEVTRRGLTGVDVPGWVTGDARAAVLADCDVFCLPSHAEGLPIVVLEAMVVGLPIVATRVGAVDEQVLDGETGLLVPARDPAALSQALVALLTDPSRAAAMGDAGRLRVDAVFGVEPIVTELVAVWRAAASGWRDRPQSSAGNG